MQHIPTNSLVLFFCEIPEGMGVSFLVFELIIKEKLYVLKYLVISYNYFLEGNCAGLGP